MSLTTYPTLRLRLTPAPALKLRFLPAIPGTDAARSAAAAAQAAADAQAAAAAAVAATANKVDKTGDVMSGFLTLNANPTAPLHAATKQYVDVGGGSGAPTNAEYITASADATLSAERVLTNTATVTWDFTTPGQAKATAVGGGGGAPTTAEYVTSTSDATLSAERVLTDTATITWDRTTPGQIKANTAAGGGNVSNSGTPTSGQYAKWVTATTIQGVATATVLSDIGALSTTVAASMYQPLDADLTSLAGASATNAIYYRSAANTWSTVTIGTGLTFTTGTLDRAALTGDVTAPGGSNTTTIANDAVIYAKMQNVSAASLLIGRGSAAGAGDPEEITLGTNLSMSGTTLNATGGGGSGFSAPQGRLTLQTATPVMTTTQSAKTTIFYSAYVGDQVPIYNGTTWTMTAITGGEISVGTTDTTKSPAAIGANKVNDWFIWSDAGTLRIGHGPDWTNDTARSAGTALVMVNGILLNSIAITNGPGALRGTYVGTTRSTAASQLTWTYGGSAAGGVRGTHYVWNMYNRRMVCSIVNDTTGSETYTTTTWKMFLGGANNAVDFVSGLAEDCWQATGFAYAATSTNTGAVGIGYDVSNANAGGPVGSIGGAGFTAVAQFVTTSVGKHTVNFIEMGDVGVTFYGTSGTAVRDGLVFEFLM